MPVSRAAFVPAWWLSNRHLQTVWPVLFRRRPRLALSTERLRTADGDFLDLCWAGAGNGPIAAIFHGLEGCIRSHYALPVMRALTAAGWRTVFMHFRGCSGVPNRLDRSYHSGETGDIRFLLTTLAERFPATPLAAIGYSLGGNALLKYLGEEQIGTPLRAAVAVSAPFLLADGADALDRGFARLYQRHLLRRLRKKITQKFANRPCPVSIDNLQTLRNFWQFDEQITAPLHGFAGAEDYYRRCSSRRYLQRIRIPTLLIHAEDDPFMSPAAIPPATELSDKICLELSPRGGHVGFIGGVIPGFASYWLDQRIPAFLKKHASI